MYCPSCGSQYRQGFTVCSDCQVPLVAEPPQGAAAEVSLDDTNLVQVWSGSDPSRHSDVLEILAGENIPARTVHLGDYAIYANTHQTLEVYVPSELAVRATELLRESKSSQEAWEELAESGALEIPAEDDALEDETDADAAPAENGDGMVQIWSGADSNMAGMIAMSLRENRIPYQGDPDPEPHDPPEVPSDVTDQAAVAAGEPKIERLYVHPENARRGKEIVREILNAQPPS
jgi:hypothetical protein